MTRIRKPWPGELDASGEIIDHEIEPPMKPRERPSIFDWLRVLLAAGAVVGFALLLLDAIF